jgi:hypothetical protein
VIKYIDKQDILMIGLLLILYPMHLLFRLYFQQELFNVYHISAISFGYGGYIVLRLFTFVQERNAVKKGLTSELKRINEIGNRDDRDKPRWIK